MLSCIFHVSIFTGDTISTRRFPSVRPPVCRKKPKPLTLRFPAVSSYCTVFPSSSSRDCAGFIQKWSAVSSIRHFCFPALPDFSALASRFRHLRFAPCLGPRLNLRFCRKAFVLSGQFGPCQPFADDPSHCREKTPAVAILVLALVESETLLVQVAEQVEGLDGNIRPANRPL